MKTRIAITVFLLAAHGFLGIRGESVLARITALPPEGGTLRFKKGEYHFYEADAQTMWLDPSNNQSGEKRVVFPLVGRKNVTIDGCGSTFVFHGRAFPFAATNCTGLTFRNFTVTTRYPSCPSFVVKEKNKDGFTVKFDDGVCPYRVDQGDISFSLDGNEISTRDGRLSLHLLGRHFVVYLMAPDSPGDKGKFPASFVGVRAEDIGNREVRFTYYGVAHFRIHHHLRPDGIDIFLYIAAPGFTMAQCSENICFMIAQIPARTDAWIEKRPAAPAENIREIIVWALHNQIDIPSLQVRIDAQPLDNPP